MARLMNRSTTHLSHGGGAGLFIVTAIIHEGFKDYKDVKIIVIKIAGAIEVSIIFCQDKRPLMSKSIFFYSMKDMYFRHR